MKKTNFLTLSLTIFTCGLVFIACDKDDDNVPPPIPAKITMLTQNGWKTVNITVPKIEDGTDSSISKECISDDLSLFALDGTYDFRDSTTKCDSTIFFYSKGDWAYDMTNDSIILNAKEPVQRLSWKVVQLNENALQVKYVDSMQAGTKITKTISFTH